MLPMFTTGSTSLGDQSKYRLLNTAIKSFVAQRTEYLARPPSCSTTIMAIAIGRIASSCTSLSHGTLAVPVHCICYVDKFQLETVANAEETYYRLFSKRGQSLRRLHRILRHHWETQLRTRRDPHHLIYQPLEELRVIFVSSDPKTDEDNIPLLLRL